MPLSRELQEAIGRLAKVTVETGTDPGKVLVALQKILIFKRDVWPLLTPQERYALLTRLRHLRDRAEGGG